MAWARLALLCLIADSASGDHVMGEEICEWWEELGAMWQESPIEIDQT